MERVAVAFENERNARKIREMLESSGTASCTVCRSAAEVRRLARKVHLAAVICGFKLADDSCQSLRADLPDDCAMLMVATQSRLDLCGDASIFRLAAPVSRSALLDAVETMLSLRPRPERRRSEEERSLVRAAKERLMEREGMTEEHAHSFLQKRSMDRGMRLADTARAILEEY